MVREVVAGATARIEADMHSSVVVADTAVAGDTVGLLMAEVLDHLIVKARDQSLLVSDSSI